MKLNKVRTIQIIILFFITNFMYPQKDAENIYDGNKLYYSDNVGKVIESAEKYSKALEINPGNNKAYFNLGNSLYKKALLIKTGKISIPPNIKMTPDSLSKSLLDQASQNYAVVANSISNKDTLHKTWHNIGNCYLQKKEYKEAINAYKKALKLNTKDEETRYNMAYALKNLPKENKNNKNDKKQNEKNDKKQNEKKDEKKPQPQQNEISKEQADQLLKALMNSEKKLQGKRKQENSEKNKLEKDW